MSTLHVRNVPDDVYDALRKRAEENDTSISTETIRLLRRALRTDSTGVRKLLAQIERQRPRVEGAPSAAELIRRDRESR